MQSILAHLFLIACFVHLFFPIEIESINQPENHTKNEVEHLSRRLSQQSPWFSNNAPSTSGPMTGPIYRIDCRRGWCKEKRVHALDYSMTEVDGVWTQWFSSSHLGQQACPSDTLVTQVECSGPRCYGMRLKCSRVLDSYLVSKFKIVETDSFSEELSGYGECPDGFYLQGLMCSGDYCDNITLICVEVYPIYDDPISVPSRWFSGQSFPFSSGITSNAIYRVDCRGDWCGEKRVHTFDIYGMVLKKRGTWTPWFYSKSQSAQQVCPHGTLVTQIQCGGERCGKMRLRCGEILIQDQELVFSFNDTVTETEYFSEEGEGYGECPEDHLLMGMKCAGVSCDSISLLCSSIIARRKGFNAPTSAFGCSHYYDDDNCDDDDF